MSHPADRPLSRTPRAVAWPALLLAAGACRGTPRPLPAPPLVADSVRVAAVAPGVVHRAYWIGRGPWAVQVLDVDRRACWTLRGRKAGGAAVGRAGTLALVRGLADSARALVAGGVNADFFTLAAPAGVPISGDVQDGRLLVGPGPRPVAALLADDRIVLGPLRVRGAVGDAPLAAWNRAAPNGLALFDAAYGARTDSAEGRLVVVADSTGPGTLTVRSVDSGAVASLAPGRVALVLGPQARPALRAIVAGWRAGSTLPLSRGLALADGTPADVRQAVGGWPLLLRDGAVTGAVDSVGNEGFRGVNPRTAFGVSRDGRRLFLVTVDGRQPGWSAGISLRDLAEVMRTLGAHDAINLDGGGSTTFVVRDATGAYRIANRPSDKEGERPVANALAVVKGCR